jgi:uncharacterized protein YrrD
MNSIRETGGFLVSDASGHVVGHVECPLYGTSPDEPDALAVRSGFLFRHRFLVPATAIDAIDETSEVIGLRLERRKLQRFL